MGNILHMGLDLGSTTVKAVIIDDNGSMVYKNYRRHYAETTKHTAEILISAFEQLGDRPLTVMVTGSAGIALSSWLAVEHIQ